MARNFDFDAWRPARDEHTQEPATFTIAGETFTLQDPLPVVPAIEYMRAPATGADSYGYIVGILADPTDGERLLAAMRRVQPPMVIDDLDGLLTGIMEAYTGRPTSPPNDSSPGSPQGGTTSNGDASAPESPTPLSVVSDASGPSPTT